MTRPELAFAVVAGVWAGCLLGVSFVATPAKFMAQSITLPVALDVGRTTFHISLMIESGFAVVLVALAASAYGWEIKTFAAAFLLALLVLQWVLLLPILDARVALVIAGQRTQPSWHHLAWIAADLLRFVVLLALSVLAARGARALATG